MSSIGRRQAGADQEKFDLSKKTIRDVAAELARRTQPSAPAASQPIGGQSTSQPSVSPQSVTDPGLGDGNDRTPANLVQMEPRLAQPQAGQPESGQPELGQPQSDQSQSDQSQASMSSSATSQYPAVPGFLWARHRPFTDDPAGPAPLEALSRAIDHRLFEQPDNIALTPSSMMTTDLAPQPLVVPPSAAHPTLDTAQLPLQEGVRSTMRHEAKGPRPTIRHYPASRFSPFNQLRAAWLRHSLRHSSAETSGETAFLERTALETAPSARTYLPKRPAGMDWSTLVLGVGIGLFVGVAAIMLLQPPSGQPKPSRPEPAGQSAVSASSTSSAPSGPSSGPSSAPRLSTAGEAAMPPATLPAAPVAAIPPLPTTPSAVRPATVVPSAIAAVAAVPHVRDMTATTFGIPAALQPDKSSVATGDSSAATAKPATTAQKPAKTTTKSKAKPTQKASSKQHAPTSAATEQLSPAKR